MEVLRMNIWFNNRYFNMVEMTHGIISSVSRSFNFFICQSQKIEDDDFFKPLGKLQIPEDTELYLGCPLQGRRRRSSTT